MVKDQLLPLFITGGASLLADTDALGRRGPAQRAIQIHVKAQPAQVRIAAPYPLRGLAASCLAARMLSRGSRPLSRERLHARFVSHIKRPSLPRARRPSPTASTAAALAPGLHAPFLRRPALLLGWSQYGLWFGRPTPSAAPLGCRLAAAVLAADSRGQCAVPCLAMARPCLARWLDPRRGYSHLPIHHATPHSSCVPVCAAKRG